ncbi:hypothetical protein MY4038_002378 [Beauveria bassiana]
MEGDELRQANSQNARAHNWEFQNVEGEMDEGVVVASLPGGEEDPRASAAAAAVPEE